MRRLLRHAHVLRRLPASIDVPEAKAEIGAGNGRIICNVAAVVLAVETHRVHYHAVRELLASS